ncbi:hypothetical protein JXA56_02015 [Candidatus Micrarchaeota archaeon]|nr:hypothetical protein [Candidatus Micrarchaeota archaeon]
MKVCIYTQENVDGKSAIPVKEDRIIYAIRKIKKIFGIAQMNELYVSEDHVKEHLKRRKSFERSMLFVSVFAGLIMILALFSMVYSGRIDLWALISAFIISGFVLVLPLFKYSPALQWDEPKTIGKSPKGKKKVK